MDEFVGKPVVEYDAGGGVDDTNVVYRVSTADYEDENLEPMFEAFTLESGLENLEALSIGPWGEEAYDSSKPADVAIRLMVEHRGLFPNLKHLMFGDFGYEDCEVSWIINTNVTPLLDAFPNLETFQVRGGQELRFDGLSHLNLKSLIVQTGGLAPYTLEHVLQAKLPSLTHLELWLGIDSYGFEGTADDFRPFVFGTAYPEGKLPFNGLKYLGLLNSEIADEIAEMLEGAPILEQLEVLDLSKGTMSDEGLRALSMNEALSGLKSLNLSRNFLTDTDLADQIRSKGPDVVWGEQKSSDDDWRYVDVSE